MSAGVSVLTTYIPVSEYPCITIHIAEFPGSIRICFSSTDQTEEFNQKNQELIYLNNTLDNVLNNIFDGVVTVDSTGNFEILNSSSF